MAEEEKAQVQQDDIVSEIDSYKESVKKTAELSVLEDVFNNILEQIDKDPRYYQKNKEEIDKALKDFIQLKKEIKEEEKTPELTQKLNTTTIAFNNVDFFDEKTIERIIEDNSVSFQAIANNPQLLLANASSFCYGYSAFQLTNYIIAIKGANAAHNAVEFLDTINVDASQLYNSIRLNGVDLQQFDEGLEYILENKNLQEQIKEYFDGFKGGRFDFPKDDKDFEIKVIGRDSMLDMSSDFSNPVSFKNFLVENDLDPNVVSPVIFTYMSVLVNTNPVLTMNPAIFYMVSSVLALQTFGVEIDCPEFYDFCDANVKGVSFRRSNANQNNVNKSYIQTNANSTFVESDEDALQYLPPVSNFNGSGSNM